MIKDVIINYLPAFVLGFVFVFCTFKYIGNFKDMAEKIATYSSYKKLEDHMKCLLNENYDLKKDNAELKKQLQQLADEFKTLAEEFTLQLEHKEEEEEIKIIESEGR